MTNWATASKADTKCFGRYFQGMLEQGVYLAPSQFERGFVSTAHGDDEIAKTVAVVSVILRGCSEVG